MPGKYQNSGPYPNPEEYCRLCGHQCLARRDRGQVGRCGTGALIGFASALLHPGEEPPFSGQGPPGWGGSGTMFFTGCPLRCVFCQNWQISQKAAGREVAAEELAEAMLALEEAGAYNINLVSPTPYAARLTLALARAKEQGLTIPVIYNSGGFDSPAALRLMDGLVDIYLPDAKIAPPVGAEEPEPDERSASLVGAGNYPWVNRAALKEMFRQVGHLRLDGRGLAQGGLLIRHLVLPDNLARTDLMLPWLAEAFGVELHLSLMAQYHPAWLAAEETGELRRFPGLSRPLSVREYDQVVDLAVELNMGNTFVQSLDSAGELMPDFYRPDVFTVN